MSEARRLASDALRTAFRSIGASASDDSRVQSLVRAASANTEQLVQVYERLTASAAASDASTKK